MIWLIETALVSALVVSVAYVLMATLILAYALVHGRVRRVVPDPVPGISIMKPLRGLDDQLESNLKSFFLLDYPDFELLFGVASPYDPAIPVVRKLQQQYPQINSALIVDDRQVAWNPKISNLAHIYRHVRRDYILISDSNVRVRPEFLQEMMGHMLREGTGLVTSTIRGQGTETVAAAFENLHLNAFIASAVFSLQMLFGISITIGKSMLLRRETIVKLGGFLAFGNVLAEDHALGVRIRELGLKTRISSFGIDNINRNWSWSSFLNRHVRWAMMRRHLGLANYAAELLANPIPIAITYFLTCRSPRGAAVLLTVLLIKMLADGFAVRMMKSDLRPWHILLAPVKDLVIFCIWFIPLVKTTVSWRGREYRLTKDTLLVPVAAPALENA
jgi:ceramide glucosyltransferase